MSELIDMKAVLGPAQSIIIFEKNFLGAQPDFNDFDAVISCVSNREDVNELEYSDFCYKIKSTDPIEVVPKIYFELMEVKKVEKTSKIESIKFRLYTDDLTIRDIKDFIVRCREEYQAQKNNKLGNETFYFDQIVANDNKYCQALSFDKKQFTTNRNFGNVFFEEKRDVEERVNHFINNKAWYDKRGIPYTLGFMFHGAPGTGKCLAPDTLVFTASGDLVRAYTVNPGNQLLGPDLKPRTVLSTVAGIDQMYWVQQAGFGHLRWSCNSQHPLTIRLLSTWVRCGPKKCRYYTQSLDPSNPLPVANVFKYGGIGDIARHLGTVENLYHRGDVIDVPVDLLHKAPEYYLEDWYGMRQSSGVVPGSDLRTLSDMIKSSPGWRILIQENDIPVVEVSVPYGTERQQITQYSYRFGFEVLQGLDEIIIRNAPSMLDLVAALNGPADYDLAPAQWQNSLFRYEISKGQEGPYCGWVLDGDHRFLLADCTITHNTSTIKAIANVTRRHVINVRLAEIKSNTQLRNLFYNPVLQIINPETLNVEKYNIPIHQRFYVIEDIDCMGDLIKKREFQIQEQKSQTQKKPTSSNVPATSIQGNATTSASNTQQNAIPDIRDMFEGDEELDHYFRESLAKEKQDMLEEEEEIAATDKITLDSLLNILDGTLEIPNRMFCITTNHIEVIDPALIRPGRVDMIIEFKNCNRAIIQEMFESFYEKTFQPMQFQPIQEYKISPAVVNQYLFKNMTNPNRAIEELTVLSKAKGKYNKTKKLNS